MESTTDHIKNISSGFKLGTQAGEKAFKDVCEEVQVLGGRKIASQGEIDSFQPNCEECLYRKENCPADKARIHAFHAAKKLFERE